MKVLNGFGIFFAWILSIVFVLLLLVAPISLSTLTLAEPEILADAITDMDFTQVLQVENADKPVVAALLKTDAAEELFTVYIEDLFKAASGDVQAIGLSVEALQELVEKHMDEILAVLKEHDAFPNKTDEEAQQLILQEVEVNGQELVETLQSYAQPGTEDAQTQAVFKTIVQAKNIRFGIVGGLVALALLIFLCRLPGWRGFRWVSVDLFIGGGILVLQCLGVLLTGGLLTQFFTEDDALVGALAGSLMGTVSSGLLIRTGVILGLAIVLMVIYCKIKKARQQKEAVA